MVLEVGEQPVESQEQLDEEVAGASAPSASQPAASTCDPCGAREILATFLRFERERRQQQVCAAPVILGCWLRFFVRAWSPDRVWFSSSGRS